MVSLLGAVGSVGSKQSFSAMRSFYTTLLIAQKRLSLSLTSAKLLLITALMLALMVAVGVTSHRRYVDQKELYEAAKLAHLFRIEDARYYKAVRVGLERPPEPLSLLAEGASERCGSSVVLSGKFAPMVVRARERLEAISTWSAGFDFSHLVGLFVSLLALLVSYDSICGEREEGTLQQCLANRVSRYQLLIGEYLGCILSLIVPLVLAVLSTVITLRIVEGFTLGQDELFRVALIFLGAALSASALIWLGLCCSGLSRGTTTAFTLAFGAWVLFSAVYPNLTLWTSQRVRPLPVTKEALSSEGVFGLALGDDKESNDQTREELGQSRELAQNAKLEQGEFNHSLELLSPISGFLALTQILSRTDVGAQRDLIKQARRLDESLRQWQDEKLRRYPEREAYYMPSWGPLDIDDLPSPQFTEIPLAISLHRTLPYWASLIAFNLIFAFLAYGLFARYDVRFG